MRLVTKKIPTVYSGFVTVSSKIYQVHSKYAEFVFCIKHTSKNKELILTNKEARSLLVELQLFLEGESSGK
jgi:hypothetical protein